MRSWVGLEGRREGGFVEFIVRNPREARPQARGNGVALANIRARIEYHFGARGQLHVEEGVDCYIARVRLPETMDR